MRLSEDPLSVTLEGRGLNEVRFQEILKSKGCLAASFFRESGYPNFQALAGATAEDLSEKLNNVNPGQADMVLRELKRLFSNPLTPSLPPIDEKTKIVGHLQHVHREGFEPPKRLKAYGDELTLTGVDLYRQCNQARLLLPGGERGDHVMISQSLGGVFTFTLPAGAAHRTNFNRIANPNHPGNIGRKWQVEQGLIRAMAKEHSPEPGTWKILAAEAGTKGGEMIFIGGGRRIALRVTESYAPRTAVPPVLSPEQLGGEINHHIKGILKILLKEGDAHYRVDGRVTDGGQRRTR